VLTEITKYLTRKIVGVVAFLHIGCVEIGKVLELRNKTYFV
jgi:hypothetical protein